jgi:hypothetical protein
MKHTTFIQDLLDLIFLNEDIPLIGDAAGLQPSAVDGNLYISLHTATPGAGGSQTTNEATYTGYLRVAVARTAGGWSRSGNIISNVATISFPLCTGGSNTITHVAIGTDSAGAGKLLYSQPLIPLKYAFTGEDGADIITAPGHTLVVDNPVLVLAVQGGTLPTGLTAGTIYYVKTVSGNDITLSATVGGATQNITADGAGLIGKIDTLAVSNLITPQFLAGQLTITELSGF